jgi:hypothetical protein
MQHHQQGSLISELPLGAAHESRESSSTSHVLRLASQCKQRRLLLLVRVSVESMLWSCWLAKLQASSARALLPCHCGPNSQAPDIC